jgi:hypothetical protein
MTQNPKTVVAAKTSKRWVGTSATRSWARLSVFMAASRCGGSRWRNRRSEHENATLPAWLLGDGLRYRAGERCHGGLMLLQQATEF